MNNNTTLIWNAILTLAVAVLFFLHFSGKNQETGTATSGAVGDKQIVYVQVDTLLNNYEFFKDARKEFENKRYQADYELNTKGKSLENEIAFFQQKAQTMTLEQARSVEAQLQKKQQDFVAYRESVVQKLAKEESDKNEELYNDIHDYIEKYNKENKYEFVLGYTRGGGILFADKTLNVTQKVLDGLNETYKAKAKKDDKKAAGKDSTAKK